MSEEILNIQLFLVTNLIASLVMVLVFLVYPKIRKSQMKQSVSNKIVLLFMITVVGILTALLAISHYYEVSPLDETGDVSNWATLVIEIGIGTAIGSSIFLYSNVQQKKSDEELSDVKKISTKLDGMMEDVKKTNDEQSQMIKEMKPIIEELKEIIETKNNQDRIKRKMLFDTIVWCLKSSKKYLLEINRVRLGKNNSFLYHEEIKRQTDPLDGNVETIKDYLNQIISWLDPEISKIIKSIHEDIFKYTHKIFLIGESIDNNEFNFDDSQNYLDNIAILKSIDDALEKISNTKSL